ncbi:MAG: DEAD/DEAH box helicase, partial [bacterium]
MSNPKRKAPGDAAAPANAPTTASADVGEDTPNGGGVVQVAVAVPLRRVFDYRWDGGALVAGARVKVPFGRRRMVGVVVGSGAPAAARRLKRIAEVLDRDNLFGARVLELLLWAARYYHHPLGEVLQTALPAALRKGAPPTDPNRRRYARACADADAAAVESLARAPAQARVHRHLRGAGWVETAALAQRFADSAATLRRLRDKGLVEIETRTPERSVAASVADCAPVELDPAQRDADHALTESNPTPRDANHTPIELNPPPSVADCAQTESNSAQRNADHAPTESNPSSSAANHAPPELNPPQRDAVEAIAACAGRFGSFLLHGVTGSGKTEVYLEAARRCVAGGGQALLLVPEIALTPQLVARVRERLGDSVCVLHSGLSLGERYRAWWRARGGDAVAVLGTRSAVF